MKKWRQDRLEFALFPVFEFQFDCNLVSYRQMIQLYKHYHFLIKMLSSTKRPSGVSFLNYGPLQSINSIKISNIQQQETESSISLPKKDLTHLTLDYKSLRFYQPTRKFINRHKIMQRKTKTKPSKQPERVNNAKVIRRVIPLPPRGGPVEAKTTKEVLIGVFDWMMEVAALMKVTKNAYYRAICILYAASRADGRLTKSKHINELACAALAMGCKLQCSQRNYLEDVFLVNCRRVSKLDISHAQHCILKALNWKIPVRVELQQTLASILEWWQVFLWECGGKLERSMHVRCYESSRLTGSIYIQIVYVLDYLVIRCHDWLQSQTFTTPILLSIYIIFGIRAGDARLDKFTLWGHFSKFVDYHELLAQEELEMIKEEIKRCCSEFGILEALGEIPLGFTFEKLIRKRNEQLYIPKIECIL